MLPEDVPAESSRVVPRCPLGISQSIDLAMRLLERLGDPVSFQPELPGAGRIGSLMSRIEEPDGLIQRVERQPRIVGIDARPVDPTANSRRFARRERPNQPSG